MQVQIHPSWEKALRAEFEDPYFQNLIAFVKSENIYSRKIFEDLGFTVEISDEGIHKYTKYAKKK